jgi:hypothetical protein
MSIKYYYYKSTGNTRLIYQELSEIMTGKGIKEQTLRDDYLYFTNTWNEIYYSSYY